MSQPAIDPASLSYPAPDSSTASSSQSPAPPSPGQSRKRQRLSEPTASEEKKVARAERNRIAAQESRDRRKKEFADLHKRVAELEAENAALRQSTQGAVIGNERTTRSEQENAELLERVARLEAALTSIMPLISGSRSSTSTPVTPTSEVTAPPAPTPSLDSANLATRIDESSSLSSDSTRHLARVATIPTPSLEASVMPQQRVDPATLIPMPSISTLEPSATSVSKIPPAMTAILSPPPTSQRRLISPSMILPYHPALTSSSPRLLRSLGPIRLLSKMVNTAQLQPRSLNYSMLTVRPQKCWVRRPRRRRR
ncbi:uncharacterized protein EI90DRAFT_2186673 [Cantharellus anzutake]|uniref:uncharacterized protein n=1 Tax=Cantharellus anzutake TaxID=1750568 RepID=UPI001907E4BC|nr:uncharacterized protein EI90DRAFT_2186673 [Cantharellus anzutake]KAF8325275.1 hypothetical protein EI90DRAFT_2186673 [Cantharellus anzutake]